MVGDAHPTNGRQYHPRFWLRRRKNSSSKAPSNSAPPMTVYSSDEGTFNIWVKVGRMRMIDVPMSTPNTLPSPPRRLQPPSTAPAIAYSSKKLPVLLGCTEF